MPVLENSAYFNVAPATSVVNFPAIDGSVQTVDFCLSANGVHPDVEILIVPVGAARPGFDAMHQIIYRNKGNQTVSGQITFQYDDNVLDFIQAGPSPDTQFIGNLGFNYSNLPPFGSRNIFITLNVNGPMEIPAVNIDDVLSFNAAIVANVSDGPTVNNDARLNQVVVGSYDPNDKQCLDGTFINPSQIGDYLHYVIHFENTGTAAAENIVVKDVIDENKFEMASLQMLFASHEAVTKIKGNTAEFIFEGIHLEAGAHGHVVFKIKTKSNLTVNSSVSNKADIFFDYNFPVVTEPAVTTFQVLENEAFGKGLSIRVFPNPTRHTVRISAQDNIKSVAVYDVQGRLLQTNLANERESKVSLEYYANGTYFLKVDTVEGSQVQKIIKQ